VIKRSRELSQLSQGGIRRRLKFADDTTQTDIDSQTATYANAIVTQRCSLFVKREQWGTIRWYPASLPPYHPDDVSTNRKALQLVLGLTPEGLAKGLWDVIPWTWLLGWFTNVGKYTLAHSWTVPATHGTGCFMSQAEATYSSSSVTATAAQSASLSGSGSLTKTIKTRAVSSSVVAGANIPFVDMWRLSILGSLFVQRFFK
jgi:hypothetical protein